MELLFLSFYTVGAGFMLIFAFRRQQPLPPLIAGGVLLAAGVILFRQSYRLSIITLGLALLLFAAGIFLLLRRRSAADQVTAASNNGTTTTWTLPE